VRIKCGYELVEHNGQFFVSEIDNASKQMAVSEYSAFLWKLLNERPVTKSQMLECLLDKFNISTVLALGEIDNFLRMLRKNEIVE